MRNEISPRSTTTPCGPPNKGRKWAGFFGFDNFGALHIDGIWVDATKRRSGIGKRLVEAAEKLAKQRGCRCVCLFTMDFQALDFYRALGYVEEFRRAHYHGNSVATYLIKVLPLAGEK